MRKMNVTTMLQTKSPLNDVGRFSPTSYGVTNIV